MSRPFNRECLYNKHIYAHLKNHIETCSTRYKKVNGRETFFCNFSLKVIWAFGLLGYLVCCFFRQFKLCSNHATAQKSGLFFLWLLYYAWEMGFDRAGLKKRKIWIVQRNFNETNLNLLLFIIIIIIVIKWKYLNLLLI